MAKNYWNLTPSSVLSKFRSEVPCSCHQTNVLCPPTYNVRTITGTKHISGRGPIIREIVIECTACNKSRKTEVERKEIYENDFNPW